MYMEPRDTLLMSLSGLVSEESRLRDYGQDVGFDGCCSRRARR